MSYPHFVADSLDDTRNYSATDGSAENSKKPLRHVLALVTFGGSGETILPSKISYRTLRNQVVHPECPAFNKLRPARFLVYAMDHVA